MADWDDNRSAVRSLATPAERARCVPEQYELLAPIVAGGALLSTARIRLKDGPPFVATSFYVGNGAGTVRLFWDDVEGGDDESLYRRNLSVGDIPINTLAIPSGSSMNGDGICAPFYVRGKGGLSVEAVGGAAAGVKFGMTGMRVPMSLYRRVRAQLGQPFMLVVQLAANDATPRDWEVPAGWKLLLRYVRNESAAVAVTVTSLTVDAAHVRLFPLGVTSAAVVNVIPALRGKCPPQPYVSLVGGDVVRVKYDGDTAQTLVFEFTRF